MAALDDKGAFRMRKRVSGWFITLLIAVVCGIASADLNLLQNTDSEEIIQLNAPTNLILSSDGILTWDAVDGAKQYECHIVFYMGDRQLLSRILSINEYEWSAEGSRLSYDCSRDILETYVDIYTDDQRIARGDTLTIRIKLRAEPASNCEPFRARSAYSNLSNSIDYNGQLPAGNDPVPDISSFSSVLYLPDHLAIIEEEAFAGINCEAVKIPDSCTLIERHAFLNCLNLKYIQVPENTVIENAAFEGCQDIEINRVSKE